MAWTCPPQEYQASMTGSARTGRVCEFLPAPDAKELDTDPGRGVRFQRTTPAGVRVEIGKDETSGD